MYVPNTKLIMLKGKIGLTEALYFSSASDASRTLRVSNKKMTVLFD